eukprot:6196999-Pleurochrysis_carterae.AAC.3
MHTWKASGGMEGMRSRRAARILPLRQFWLAGAFPSPTRPANAAAAIVRTSNSLAAIAGIARVISIGSSGDDHATLRTRTLFVTTLRIAICVS